MPPTLIAHYHLRRLLGAGGMGEVYLAEDTHLNRQVALKLLPQVHDADRLSRFIDEAKAASAVNHPNVAHIYEIGAAGDVAYIAMEYVEGESLRAKIAHGTVPQQELIEVAIQIADALDEAHRKAIVHRDIKSANILVTPRGQVKVLDFGLAKRLVDADDVAPQTRSAHETATGAIVGTVHYMSPEQAVGQPVDHRSDLFSFGVVLYELATGRLPFDGANTAAVLGAIARSEPEAIARFNYAVTLPLEQIIRKCLEKDRDCRYQSARELLVDLRNLRRDSDSTERARNMPRRHRRVGKTIAVLPLVNEGGDNTEYLTDGITETIIDSLSLLPDLRVMARSTVFRFKGREVDALAAGRTLNVDTVLTGRVLIAGDRVQVGAELVDVADGSRLWGARFNQPLSDLYAVQEAIAAEIVPALRIKLKGDDRRRLAKQHTTNAAAYEAYLKGRYHFNQRTREGFARAIEFFKAAIGSDAQYALAHAGLADCYTLLATAGFAGASEVGREARPAAERALALDANLSEAHAAMGLARFRLDWDWPAAEQALGRARELNPGAAAVHHRLALLYTALGRLDEATDAVGIAQQLDPLSSIIGTAVGRVHQFARRFEAAVEQCHRVLAFEPTFLPAQFDLAMAQFHLGRADVAIELLERRRQDLETRPVLLAVLAHIHARAGASARARAVLADLLERRNNGEGTSYDVGMVLVGLGEHDRAIDWLERARVDRDGVLVYIKVEPLFDALRDQHRFMALQTRLRL